MSSGLVGVSNEPPPPYTYGVDNQAVAVDTTTPHHHYTLQSTLGIPTSPSTNHKNNRKYYIILPCYLGFGGWIKRLTLTAATLG